MRYKENQNIEEQILMIRAYLNDELDEDGETQFQSWLAENETNQILMNRIQNNAILHQKLKFIHHNDLEMPWANIQRRINKPFYYRLISKGWAYAAAVSVIVGLTILFLVRESKHEQNLSAVKVSTEKANPPKILLTLTDGRNITLGSQKGSTRIDIDGNSLNEDNDALTVKNHSNATSDLTEYNRLIVPRGTDYKLTLEDGTQVWLNADTRIDFPTVFAKNERRIKVHGEAYFKVTKNPRKPFIVETDQKQVKVLGTSFNVNSHGGYATTLVEGKVEILYGGSSYVLFPDHQAVEKDGQIVINSVDTYDFTAWKDGIFIFSNQSLGEILSRISRLYDINVEYKDKELISAHFSGKLKRYANLEEILSFIERTNTVHFELKGKILTVSK